MSRLMGSLGSPTSRTGHPCLAAYLSVAIGGFPQLWGLALGSCPPRTFGLSVHLKQRQSLSVFVASSIVLWAPENQAGHHAFDVLQCLCQAFGMNGIRKNTPNH